MKKIMIAAAIVCAAAYVQAGAFIWGTVGGVEGPSEAYELSDITATLFIGSDQVASATVDPDGIFGNWNPDNAPSTDSHVNQLVSAEDFENCQTFRLLLATTDGKYTFTDSVAASPFEEIGMGSSTFVQMAYFENPIGAGDWQSVPEPTSGLLLLLGVAGLALRRRRA